MSIDIFKQLDSFKVIRVPKYIDSLIQQCAIIHLNVKDMGELRDRMEGQLYYDRLKIDILSEFAFETIVGRNKIFDWDKRKLKGYRRKHYIINNRNLTLISFSSSSFPQFNINKVENCIFCYVKPDQKVYISGLGLKSDLIENSFEIPSPVVSRDVNREFREFGKLRSFKNFESLCSLLD